MERGLEVLEALAVEDRNTALNLYLVGDLDYVHELPPEVTRDLIEEARRGGKGAGHLHHGPSLTVYFYHLNLRLPVFQGEAGRKLRRALALAVDRASIARDVARGEHLPAFRMVPPGIPGYPAGPLLGSGDLETDIAEARRLVDEVRRERGPIPRLRVLYNTSETHEKIAAAVQALWRTRLGIDVDLANQEWGVFLDSRRGGDFDIARASWIADYPDPATFLDVFRGGSPNNDTGYSSPAYDELLDAAARPLDLAEDRSRRGLIGLLEEGETAETLRARRRPDGSSLLEEVRAALGRLAAAPAPDRAGPAAALRLLLLQAAEEVLMRDAPAVPIFFHAYTQLWPPGLEGLHLNASDYHPPRFLRWAGGLRPAGSRAAELPRFPARTAD